MVFRRVVIVGPAAAARFVLRSAKNLQLPLAFLRTVVTWPAAVALLVFHRARYLPLRTVFPRTVVTWPSTAVRFVFRSANNLQLRPVVLRPATAMGFVSRSSKNRWLQLAVSGLVFTAFVIGAFQLSTGSRPTGPDSEQAVKVPEFVTPIGTVASPSGKAQDSDDSPVPTPVPTWTPQPPPTQPPLPTSTPIPDTTAPVAPSNLQPVDGSVFNQGVVGFSWDAVSDPSGVTYDFEIHTSEDFTSPYLVVADLGDLTYELSPDEALPDDSYWWRVRSADGAGNVSEWSHPRFVVDSTAPPVPVTESPTLGAVVFTDSRVNLSWDKVEDQGAVAYEIEIGEDPTFDSGPIEGIRTPDDTVSLDPQITSEPGRYHWRIRSEDEAGNHGNWATSYFTITDGPIGPEVAHTITGRGDCLGCHTSLGLWPVPVSHAGRENSTCQSCHGLYPGGPPRVGHSTEARITACGTCHTPKDSAPKGLAPLPASHAGRDVPTCTMCHEPPITLPPDAPHDYESGGPTCVTCHSAAGVAGDPPPSHDGRSPETCVACHDESSEKPNLITHSTSARENCTGCHSERALAPLKETHSGRTVEMCASCHVPATLPSPEITHSLAGKASCLNCHGETTMAPAPATHANRTEAMCSVCHDVSLTQPVTIAHGLDDRASCLTCHAEGRVANALPDSHVKRTEVQCLACHEDVAEPPESPHALADAPACSTCHAKGEVAGSLPVSHDDRPEATCTLCHEAKALVPPIPHAIANRGDCVFCHIPP